MSGGLAAIFKRSSRLLAFAAFDDRFQGIGPPRLADEFVDFLQTAIGECADWVDNDGAFIAWIASSKHANDGIDCGCKDALYFAIPSFNLKPVHGVGEVQTGVASGVICISI